MFIGSECRTRHKPRRQLFQSAPLLRHNQHVSPDSSTHKPLY
jgi:hypothetical protein